MICMCRENHPMTSQELQQAVVKPNWCSVFLLCHMWMTFRLWLKVLQGCEEAPDRCWVEFSLALLGRSTKNGQPGIERIFCGQISSVSRSMGWAMNAAAVGHPTVCYGTLNSAKYRAILQTHILFSIKVKTGCFNRIMLLATYAGPQELDCSVQIPEWPSQSPDMNPVGNLSWIIKRFVSKLKPKNLEELKAEIPEEWIRVTLQQCERHLRNMPARIRALLLQQRKNLVLLVYLVNKNQ